MAPQQNSVEKIWSQKKIQKREKSRNTLVIKIVRSVRSGHLVMLLSFLVGRSDSIKSSEVSISVMFRIRS